MTAGCNALHRTEYVALKTVFCCVERICRMKKREMTRRKLYCVKTMLGTIALHRIGTVQISRCLCGAGGTCTHTGAVSSCLCVCACVRVRQLPRNLPPQILDGVSVGAGGWIDEIIRVIDCQMLEPIRVQ